MESYRFVVEPKNVWNFRTQNTFGCAHTSETGNKMSTAKCTSKLSLFHTQITNLACTMLQQEVSAVEAWANGRVFNIDVRKWVGNDETDAPEDHLAEWDDLENDESFEDYSSYGDIYTWNDSDVENFIAFIKKNLFNDSSLRDEDIEYID